MYYLVLPVVAVKYSSPRSNHQHFQFKNLAIADFLKNLQTNVDEYLKKKTTEFISAHIYLLHYFWDSLSPERLFHTHIHTNGLICNGNLRICAH